MYYDTSENFFFRFFGRCSEQRNLEIRFKKTKVSKLKLKPMENIVGFFSFATSLHRLDNDIVRMPTIIVIFYMKNRPVRICV